MVTDFIEIYDNVLSHEVCVSFLNHINNSNKVRRNEKNLKDIWYVPNCRLSDKNPLIHYRRLI